VSNHYLDNLAREVNERLQQRGTLPVPSLTKEYDLPTEFLLDQVRFFFLTRGCSSAAPSPSPQSPRSTTCRVLLDQVRVFYNERLQQHGTLPVPSLTKEYNLPTEFLLDQVRFLL
jgi:hypothetical protein